MVLMGWISFRMEVKRTVVLDVRSNYTTVRAILSTMNTQTTRKPRADGVRSRQAILDAAARLATVEGLNGLSIGGLADHIGMSKSGLYAHFKSKEELQLATIDTASEVFDAEVVRPAAAAPAGRARLWALSNEFLAHLERGVFPGGCFFASVAAEIDTRPGRVRDRIVEFIESWVGELLQPVKDAQAAGEIDPAQDAAQLTFEVNAMLLMANAAYVMDPSPEVLERARRGIERLIGPAPTG
jgi:AcrR family transcriptional regulator